MSASYFLYIVECADGSLYTGISTDVDRRLEEHTTGVRGARYVRGRTPLTLVFATPVGDRSRASSAEARVKRLSKRQKRSLIDGSLTLDSLLDQVPVESSPPA